MNRLVGRLREQWKDQCRGVTVARVEFKTFLCVCIRFSSKQRESKHDRKSFLPQKCPEISTGTLFLINKSMKLRHPGHVKCLESIVEVRNIQGLAEDPRNPFLQYLQKKLIFSSLMMFNLLPLVCL